MSICPKNKSSKGRRDKRRANWKMTAPSISKMQQVRRFNDASQSMQELWLIQQERNYSSGLIFKKIRGLSRD